MRKNFILAQEERKVIRCSHCGGAMRDYREGVSCLLCGRTLEHSCERCKYPEYSILTTETYKKKVA